MDNVYRKRPVDIEAWLWNESKATLKEIGCGYIAFSGHAERPDECRYLSINTLEGSMRVNKGDYIIKGVKGEFYPCKPDIFKMTYDKVHPAYVSDSPTGG